jgi:sugar lactone lactonase YvrE
MRYSRLGWVLLTALVASIPLWAVETSFWQVGSFEEFLQGKLANVSLSQDGSLRLAPESRMVFNPEEALALSLARAPNGTLYVGTGHQGKVFRVDTHQKASLFFAAQEPDIFALAVGPDDALYVGSSPEGKVYRVTRDGKSKVFYDPNTKYIWAMAFDAQGRLYVATGDKGQIFRVDPSGKGGLFYDSKQTHIMCLVLDRHGDVLAGTDPNGLIYRITPQGKAFVIYQAGLPEIHSLATDSQGNIYAAALGSAGGKTSPQILFPTTPTQPIHGGVTTVTVTAATEEAGKESPKGQNPPAQPSTVPSFNRPTTLATPTPGFRLPQGRGQIVEIRPDSTTDTLWSSNNESIFGLAVRDGHVLFSTDSNGRIFDLTPSPDGEQLTLLTETHESLATRLLLAGSDLYVATSNIAKLFRIETTPTQEGTYESAVKDTKFISHWGILAWRATTPAGTSLEFYSRSGNSERPDNTWSDWSGPYRDPNGSAIQSPPARYIQWKGAFHSSGQESPILDEVTVSYLNQNMAPEIRSLDVSTSGERTGPAASGSTSSQPPGTTISVTASSPTSFSPAASAGGRPTKTPVTLTWQAEDPNGDTLIYSLYAKGTDERDWHLLKDHLHRTSYTIESDALPDGKYVARLVVSDQESNPVGRARRSELLSAPFWVDNTPPDVTVMKQQVVGDGGEVQFLAEDSTSPLRSAETSLDSKPWRDVLSEDGIVDARRETFTVRFSKLAPGEHVLLLRAYDTSGNVGVGKAVVHIAAGEGAKP